MKNFIEWLRTILGLKKKVVMQKFPIAGLSLHFDKNYSQLIIQSRGDNPVKLSLKGNGVTIKVQKGSFEVSQNNPVKKKRMFASFEIGRKTRFELKFAAQPESNSLVITDFNESIIASFSASYNLDVIEVQMERNTGSLDITTGHSATIGPIS